jgi:hypothetical protein
MHALVAAVLLRMARLDALDLDAEAEPPDRELGEVEEGAGAGERGAGERDAAVGSDGLSDRMAVGRPRSWKRRSKAVLAGPSRVESRASQSSRKREAWSVAVSG